MQRHEHREREQDDGAEHLRELRRLVALVFPTRERIQDGAHEGDEGNHERSAENAHVPRTRGDQGRVLLGKRHGERGDNADDDTTNHHPRADAALRIAPVRVDHTDEQSRKDEVFDNVDEIDFHKQPLLQACDAFPHMHVMHTQERIA